jgi:hypothetical protein
MASSRAIEPADEDVGTPPSAPAALWDGVDRLIDRASVDGILYHKLGPLAAARWRRLGRPLSPSLQYEERAAALNMPLAAQLIQRLRERCEGPLVLLKGPEVARFYPANSRRFSDIDLLTPDAKAVFRSLIDAGFVESPDEEEAPTAAGHHHLPALVWPTIPLSVELHTRFNWPEYAAQPSVDEIVEASAPWSLGVEGILAPAAAHHSLILVAHAWQHEPLQTLRDLIDVAAVSGQIDESELDRLAADWGIGRIWQTTRRAIEGLFYGGPQTVPLRLWAQHLESVRSRTVVENHLRRWLSAFWEVPPGTALARAARAVRDDIRPLPGERRRDKLARVITAAHDMRAPVTRRQNDSR